MHAKILNTFLEFISRFPLPSNKQRHLKTWARLLTRWKTFVLRIDSLHLPITASFLSRKPQINYTAFYSSPHEKCVQQYMDYTGSSSNGYVSYLKREKLQELWASSNTTQNKTRSKTMKTRQEISGLLHPRYGYHCGKGKVI